METDQAVENEEYKKDISETEEILGDRNLDIDVEQLEKDVWEIYPNLRIYAFSLADDRRVSTNANEDNAENAVIDAITSVLKSIKENNKLPKETLEGYLIRSVKYAYIKIKTRRGEHITTPLHDNLIDEASNSDPLLLKSIRSALLLLSPNCRELIKLTSEGRKYIEVSEIMMIKENTVKSQLSRCRENFRYVFQGGL